MIALEGQTIFDICLQGFGTLDNMINLIQDNNSSLIYDVKNVNFVINNSGVGNEKVKRELRNKRCNNHYDISGLLLATESEVIITTEDGQTIII